MHPYEEEVFLATSPSHPFAIRGEASIYEVALDSIEATKHPVELGIGISFLPYCGVRHELVRDTLSIVPLTEGHKVAIPTSVMVAPWPALQRGCPGFSHGPLGDVWI
jgi:DNA-binding transcriptional LysR family regulator